MHLIAPLGTIRGDNLSRQVEITCNSCGLGEVVSPASLLDSHHGCIASPHAKESGQTS